MIQFPIKLIGFDQSGLSAAVGKTLTRISWPLGQSLECTWRLELLWDEGETWIVQGQPTMTDSGHEMSSVRVEKLSRSSLPEGLRRDSIELKGFVLRGIQVASALEAGVNSDCAVALHSTFGEVVVIATAPAPGAVTVQLGQGRLSKTEFKQSDFVWRRVSTAQ